MPTGYTAPIGEGKITFSEFAMQCARAFGACITMRDEPSDTPIPEAFEPSDFSSLQKMAADECEKASEKACKDSASRFLAGIEKDAELKRKYEAMLKQVDAWTPPSAEHAELKKFMRDQIAESIRFDCGCDYYERELKALKQQSAEQWRRTQISEAQRQIAYHTKKHAEEVERMNSRTKWVKELRESLTNTPSL